ncbi:MAG: N-acetylmannosamine-6-phosphate 2-epimerase [Schwartzia sp.]|nr:N-acetylmannosamine-6-phosphate 2-epimerase [Schwartzia sp. (in: firmicutes)]
MDFFAAVKGRLIVSCQALSDEPLHSPFIMGRMALAAKMGGASAIRAQSSVDIREIQKVTGLPVIGLVKQNYEDSPVYITPTMAEVEDLLTAGCEMIALDMTGRPRPAGEKAETLVARIHEAGRLVLADISTYEEGVAAAKLNADAISTTLSGYTPYSPQLSGPDVDLVERLSRSLSVPVFAEGRINVPEDIDRVMKAGAFAPIVGSAITRPQIITARFAERL